MKKSLLLFSLFITVLALAQSFGPAQGFPSDPVISAAFEGDRLYLGTQGSGVYELLDGFIKPSTRFENSTETPSTVLARRYGPRTADSG